MHGKGRRACEPCSQRPNHLMDQLCEILGEFDPLVMSVLETNHYLLNQLTNLLNLSLIIIMVYYNYKCSVNLSIIQQFRNQYIIISSVQNCLNQLT